MRELQVNLWDLVGPLAKTVDMMSPAVAQHHMRTAYLAMRLSEELGLPADERRDIVIASTLHDIGAFSLNERLDLLEFEETRPMQHSMAGYLLLKSFRPFSAAAALVEFHHVPWRHGQGAASGGKAVPRGSHLIHLADRVTVLIARDRPVLSQVGRICEIIGRRKGETFVPEFVDALLRLAEKDYLWMEVASDAIESILKRNTSFPSPGMDLDMLIEFSRLIGRVIDFRSGFTATHSSGVAAVATVLARRVGFSEQECRMLEIAAYLHDLGKLAIPTEILEKPDKLTTDEWQVMRTHVYYTYQILEPIAALSLITTWGALHQERLNGTGYPFRYTAADLPLGSRIMAVADVFTAITEDRPYRNGMEKESALDVLEGMADRGELEGRLVKTLRDSFDEVNAVRSAAQAQALREYEEFRSSLE
jgi:HD-GYP domain-containing protein (c-di-GMP phosphodiesterase class II)